MTVVPVLLFFTLLGLYGVRVLKGGFDSVGPVVPVLLGIIAFSLLLLVGLNGYFFLFRRKSREGVQLRRQLVFIFSLLVLLASVPQSLLTLNLIEIVMNLWVGESLETTLEDSSNLLIDYYGDVNRNLESFCESEWLRASLERYGEEGSFPWLELKRLNWRVSSLQVFSPGGYESFGENTLRFREDYVRSYPGGFLPVRTERGRLLISYAVDHGDIRFVLSSLLAPGTVELGRRLDEQTERLGGYNEYQQDQLRWKLYFILLFMLPLLLISVNMALLFAGRLIHPVQELGMALRRVTQGDYSYRISVEDFGAYDFYVDIFNEMIDELNSSRSDLVQSEKIGVWRDIAQRLAHEIRNPLTPIKLSAQRILMKASQMDEEAQRYLMTPMNRILKEVDELDLLLREFREFAGQRAPVLRDIKLVSLINEVWDSYAKDGDNTVFSLHDDEEERTILGDASQLKQVFRNLFSNALTAMDYRGRLSVRITSLVKGTQNYCRITVRDWGVGIDEETLSRIFEPYFTTRKTGTGLGLPIVERIITDHKGRIWVESSPGEGTVFYIDLPVGRSE